MTPSIKIAIIGGTGKAGKYLVNQLISQGYYFKALVRHPENFIISSSLCEVVTGDVADYTAIHTLISGCDAVISTLGMGIPPGKPTIFSTATANILKAMKAVGICRYIVITGLNVNTPFDAKSTGTKAATQWMYANYPISTVDKQKEYELLASSDSCWTLVRLPIIEQTDDHPEITVSLKDCPGTGISATSLAHFLINQLTDNRYNRKAPFISSI